MDETPSLQPEPQVSAEQPSSETAAGKSAAASAVSKAGGENDSLAERASLDRRLYLVLSAIGLVYAFLAGLRTVSDFDFFWQLATGRWVAQHHHVFSTDVFSYTAYGQPWVYPVGSGLLFYAAYLLGGYSLISWMGAAACCGTVALLLRRGSAFSAGIAILAVPLIAYRTVPRADMFTVVLFAAFLSLLWEHYQTGSARLWLLPLLMLAWVNLHLGFVAGLALLLAFAGMDVLEVLFGDRRREHATRRLKSELPWFAATVVATLANPWGWSIYQALLRQDRAMAQHAQWLSEWFGLRLNWAVAASVLHFRQTEGAVYTVLAIAVIAAIVALFQRQPGAAILLMAAVYASVQHIRMEALTACVVVVVGGSILSDAAEAMRPRLTNKRAGAVLAMATVGLLAILATVRAADLVSNRHYYELGSIYTFGAGLGWWLPRGAAAFVEHAKIGGQVFNTYEEGGYLTWRLGPARRDYIDGRAIPFGPESFRRQQELQLESLDSAKWREEAGRYNIEAFVLPLARFQLLSLIRLHDFCNSRDWRPVYLDEFSAVFVRRKPETEELIRRYPVNCEAATLSATSLGESSGVSFQQWANVASVLGSLGRPYEALQASEKALAISPDAAEVHWMRGNLLAAKGSQADAEKEFVAAVALDPTELNWNSLGDFYYRQGRLPEALRAKQQAVRFSYQPYMALLQLSQYYLQILEPKLALQTLDEAVQRAPAAAMADSGKHAFRFEVAHARASAWRSLGDAPRAIEYGEEAVRVAPDDRDAWNNLAKLYSDAGRVDDQHHAEERAKAAEATRSGDSGAN